MKLPTSEHTTANAILKCHESKPQNHRLHLGASEIGKECLRALWYSFRWATKKQFSGRILRLFETGFKAEERFISELKSIGVEIYDRDPETGRQHVFSLSTGHFGGSCDGIGRGFPEAPKTWAIVEFKTHSDKSFNSLVKDKVQKSKPEHYAQMQVYMGMAELDRALYLAVNKDNEELYSEWVKFDHSFFESLIKKAQRIINSPEPLERMSNDPAWFQCKFCDHNEICHQGKIANKNCRTCAFSTPKDDGKWHCYIHKKVLSFSEQEKGCSDHLFIPPLISFAEVQDTGKGFVSYNTEDGKNIVNCSDQVKSECFEGDSLFLTSDDLQGKTLEMLLNEKA